MSQVHERITVVLSPLRFARSDWDYPFEAGMLREVVEQMDEDFRAFGFQVEFVAEPERVIEVRGYPDLLNAIRIRSSRPGLGNLCLGHIIGSSANLDLLEDLRRGVKRVAFAPETIEPDGSDKVVCHNCGCGC